MEATTGINSNHQGPQSSTSSNQQAEEEQQESNNHHTKKDVSSNDKDNDPKKFPVIKKNTILFLVAIGGSISPVASTIYYPALISMQQEFHTTATTMNASLSIFTFFTAIFPVIWATFGDLFGRKRIYLISLFIACIGSICCAVSVNVSMFLVFRALSAIGSSSTMSMGAGTIADVFEPYQRGRAFAYFTCGPLLGPAIGPLLGGYLNQGLGWRSNFWFLAIYCFLIWFGFVLFMPETWRPPVDLIKNDRVMEEEKMMTTSFSNPATSTNHNESMVKDSKKGLLDIKKDEQQPKRRLINPIGALKLLKFPNIALSVTYVGVLFFMLYLNNTNFTRIYTLQYGFDSGTVGLCYLPIAAGSVMGGIVGGRMSDKIYNRRVVKAQEQEMEIYPEMRLGGPLFYASILLQLMAFVGYGWFIEKNTHFAYGLVCQFFIGLSIMLPVVTLAAYMVDCFRNKGASVTACNNCFRYIMAGIGSLIATVILEAMGSGPLFTFCGCLSLVSASCMLIIKKYTKKWALLRANDK